MCLPLKYSFPSRLGTPGVACIEKTTAGSEWHLFTMPVILRERFGSPRDDLFSY